MMHTVLLVTIAPLVNVILFGSACYFAGKLSAKLPEGRLKRILYKKL